MRPYLKQFILGPMFKVIEAIFELIVPLVMAAIIDRGVANGDRAYIFRMGGVLLALAAVGLCSTLVCQILASQASQGIGTDLRNALFDRVTILSHAELDRFGAASMTQRITSDVNQIQLAVAMIIRLLIRAPFLAVGAAFMAFSIDVKLSLVLFAMIPLIALVLWFVMNKCVPYFRQNQRRLDGISRLVREGLGGARVIRAFSRQDAELERFEAAGSEYAETAVKAGRLSALLNPLTSLIMNSGVVLLIWCGALRVDTGYLTQGELVAFVNYITQISLALVVVANVVGIFTRASASVTRVGELLSAEPSVSDTPSAAPLDFGETNVPAVELDDVSFGYTAGKPVLRHVTLSFARGSRIGVIGGTGSGKSTLAALIMRFYDADSGLVSVLGRDVRTLSLDSLRQTVSIVPQKPALVSGTVAENLRWGKSDATDDELAAALRVAQAEDFVGRMGGLGAKLEQNGQNLSGGQKQRLSVARALARRPDILILDDSSSALDAGTDYRMRRAIQTELPGTTVIMISQRAGSLLHADQIVALDGGEVAGVGAHAELYASCPVYREICESQGIGAEK